MGRHHRLRETCCPECGRFVGVITPPRVGPEDRDKLRALRRSRHFRMDGSRQWCLGSGGVLRDADIDARVGWTAS